MQNLPPTEEDTILAVCEFKPHSDESPVCFTQTIFDRTRNMFKGHEKEPTKKE